MKDKLRRHRAFGTRISLAFVLLHVHVAPVSYHIICLPQTSTQYHKYLQTSCLEQIHALILLALLSDSHQNAQIILEILQFR